MPDIEALIHEILKQNKYLTREDILQMIKEKKESIGAGYLTDQGALYLIASELGVTIPKNSTSELRLNDIQIGLNNVSVVARVLGAYPVRSYTRKDGKAGALRKLIVYDSNLVTKLVVWDEKVSKVQSIHPGSLIRVSNCYIKQGIDGKPELALSSRGDIETIDEEKWNKALPSVNEISNVTRIEQGAFIPALRCTVANEPRVTVFKRNNTEGRMLQFRAKLEDSKTLRIVIWDFEENINVTQGESVIVTNLRARKGISDEIELHGDAASTILHENRVLKNLLVLKVGKEEPFLLTASMDKEIIPVIIPKHIHHKIKEGQMITLSSYKQSFNTITCDESSNISVSNGTAALKSFFVKLREVVNKRAIVEVIALSYSQVKDVRTKNGELVKRAEVLVGDDTDEARVVAWRENVKAIDSIQPGERLQLYGVYPASKSLERTLVVDRFTIIEKITS